MSTPPRFLYLANAPPPGISPSLFLLSFARVYFFTHAPFSPKTSVSICPVDSPLFFAPSRFSPAFIFSPARHAVFSIFI